MHWRIYLKHEFARERVGFGSLVNQTLPRSPAQSDHSGQTHPLLICSTEDVQSSSSSSSSSSDTLYAQKARERRTPPALRTGHTRQHAATRVKQEASGQQPRNHGRTLSHIVASRPLSGKHGKKSEGISCGNQQCVEKSTHHTGQSKRPTGGYATIVPQLSSSSSSSSSGPSDFPHVTPRISFPLVSGLDGLEGVVSLYKGQEFKSPNAPEFPPEGCLRGSTPRVSASAIGHHCISKENRLRPHGLQIPPPARKERNQQGTITWAYTPPRKKRRKQTISLQNPGKRVPKTAMSPSRASDSSLRSPFGKFGYPAQQNS